MRNIQNCKKYPALPPTKYVPVSYSPVLTRIKQPSENDKKYDILFYGSDCPRRHALIQRLRHEGLRVYYSTYKCWDYERDQKIAESKIVLNIHFYPKPILETTRLSYLIANGAFIISERSLDPLLDREYQDYVVFCEYDQIPEMCKKYLNCPDERRQKAIQAFDRFKERTYHKVIPLQTYRFGKGIYLTNKEKNLTC